MPIMDLLVYAVLLVNTAILQGLYVALIQFG